MRILTFFRLMFCGCCGVNVEYFPKINQKNKYFEEVITEETSLLIPPGCKEEIRYNFEINEDTHSDISDESELSYISDISQESNSMSRKSSSDNLSLLSSESWEVRDDLFLPI